MRRVIYFPGLDERIGLELVDTRTFAARVVYLHYATQKGA
jgi:hypothetical protein